MIQIRYFFLFILCTCFFLSSLCGGRNLRWAGSSTSTAFWNETSNWIDTATNNIPSSFPGSPSSQCEDTVVLSEKALRTTVIIRNQSLCLQSISVGNKNFSIVVDSSSTVIVSGAVKSGGIIQISSSTFNATSYVICNFINISENFF